MVSIDGNQSVVRNNTNPAELGTSIVKTEQEKASEELQNSFGCGVAENTSTAENNKPTKLDFTGFAKENRAAAAVKARDSLNEVRDLTRQFNADFPNKSYSPKYADFPKPEDYDKKNYGTKKDAFEAWKDDVDIWKEDAKQDIATMRSKNIDNLQKQNLAGLKAIYCKLGLTEDFIATTFQELQGDIQSVKEKLDKAVKDINANTNRVGNRVIANDNRNTAGVHAHIYDSTRSVHEHLVYTEGNLHEHIESSERDVRKAVASEGDFTRHVVVEKANQTQNVVITTAGETQGTVKSEVKKINKH